MKGASCVAGFLLQRCLCPDIRKPHAHSFRSHPPWRHRRAQPHPDGAADARSCHVRARAHAHHGHLLRTARERGADHYRGHRYQPRGHGLALCAGLVDTRAGRGLEAGYGRGACGGWAHSCAALAYGPRRASECGWRAAGVRVGHHGARRCAHLRRHAAACGRACLAAR